MVIESIHIFALVSIFGLAGISSFVKLIIELTKLKECTKQNTKAIETLYNHVHKIKGEVN